MSQLRKIFLLAIISMMLGSSYSVAATDISNRSGIETLTAEENSPYIKGRKKSSKRRKRKNSFKKAHGQSRLNAQKHKDMSNKRKGPRVYGKKRKGKSWGGSFF